MISLLSQASDSLKEMIGIENEYVLLIIISLIVFVVIKIINKIIVSIYADAEKESKLIFNFSQRVNIVMNIILIISMFIIWNDYISSFVTMISLISAGATIALREVILNFFGGIYLKVAKPFTIEDRIEIKDSRYHIKGDVILISTMSFKLLEVSNKENGHQSNGIIVNIPTSVVFSAAIKNYTTAIKYIWSELIVSIPLNANVEKSKQVLYDIVNSNEIISAIPKKMTKAIDEASVNYRIYYNNLEPIIYTIVKDDRIELAIRYLVHPKKERNVEDALWLEILKASKGRKIKLFTK